MKEYTINLDVQVFAKNEEQAIRKVSTAIHNHKLQYWIGDIREEEEEKK